MGFVIWWELGLRVSFKVIYPQVCETVIMCSIDSYSFQGMLLITLANISEIVDLLVYP